MSKIVATINRYKGVDVDAEALPEDTAVFTQHLQQSLEEWQANGLRVVWLKVPIAKAALIPMATSLGFRFHHSSESHHEEQFVMLTYALQSDSFVPPHATHYVGAGGVVLNDQRELLVITERIHVESGRPRYYKLPGGAVDQGEDLTMAVMREVREETGIETEFDSLVCFRHWHQYRFGKADIYFICRLKPLTSEIINNDNEIADCLWMPVDAYLASETVGEFNKLVVRMALAQEGLKPVEIERYTGAGLREVYGGWVESVNGR